MEFAAYVPIGPDLMDVERASELLDSLRTFGAGLKWIVVVDDAIARRDLLSHLSPPDSTPPIVLRNPRHGVGDGKTGGLCVANLVALEYICSNTTAEFVLKLDTDTLVIGPLLEQIQPFLSVDVGLIGVVGDSLDDVRGYQGASKNGAILRSLLPLPEDLSSVDLATHPTLKRWGLADAQTCHAMRQLVGKAQSNTALLGAYCQGGGYVVTSHLLRWISTTGHFRTPLMWRDILLGEDVLMGLYCAAAGLKIRDASGIGQPFAVHPDPLTATGPDLLNRHTSIIHSVKGPCEPSIRDYFRIKRKNVHEMRPAK